MCIKLGTCLFTLENTPNIMATSDRQGFLTVELGATNSKSIFLISVITIKWRMCVQEKNEVFSGSQNPRLSSIKISVDLFLAGKKKKQNKLQIYFPWGGKKLASCYPGVTFATPWLRDGPRTLKTLAIKAAPGIL